MKKRKIFTVVLIFSMLMATLTGCNKADKVSDTTKKPVIKIGSDNYPPYNFLNEDGIPTGIDVLKEWGIRWTLSRSTGRRKRSWWRAGRSIVSWAVFPWKDALTITDGQDRT